MMESEMEWNARARERERENKMDNRGKFARQHYHITGFFTFPAYESMQHEADVASRRIEARRIRAMHPREEIA